MAGGEPDNRGRPSHRVQVDRAVAVDPGALTRRLFTDEPAILEIQEIAKFRRNRHKDKGRLLAVGDPLGHAEIRANSVRPSIAAL